VAFEPGNLGEAMAMRLVLRAHQAYMAHDWEAAEALYRSVLDTEPEAARQLALAIPAGHCAIERADATALATWPAPILTTPGGEATRAAADVIRFRAMDHCRAGDFLRATTLLRFLAPIDAHIRPSYDDGLVTRRSRCAALLEQPPTDPPRFITDYDIDALPIAALKARHRGKRLLSVRRYGDTKVRHGVADSVRRSAEAFGLMVHEFQSKVQPGAQSERYVGVLRQTIAQFRPDVIWWDELFLSGISAEPEYRGAIAALLEDVRRDLGVKVIKYYPDVWYVTAHMPDDLYGALGRCYDLINHCHPAVLDRGTAAERRAVFCCPAPAAIEPPTAAAGTIARANFIGAIHPGAMPRIVWWAECARAGLPLDFIETVHDNTTQLSDLEYVNVLRSYQLSTTLTMRGTGARIFTLRVLEVPLAGGVLLEEHSADTRYFMTPGLHYAPFETIPDLAALIPALLADAPRRARMAAAAKAWVERYFTGDVYWAGLLSRLYP
jgi:hypothetical protein